MDPFRVGHPSHLPTQPILSASGSLRDVLLVQAFWTRMKAVFIQLQTFHHASQCLSLRALRFVSSRSSSYVQRMKKVMGDEAATKYVCATSPRA